jgi:hypothetical protein
MTSPKGGGWTKGPWRYEPMTDIYAIRPGQTGYLIASTCASIGYGGPEPFMGEAEADARLIAAAPDLAEALRKAVRVLEDPNSETTDREWDGVIAQARAALAKAGAP